MQTSQLICRHRPLPFQLRVGLAAIGNADDPGLWSGTPSKITAALRALGIDVVPIDVTTPLTRVIVDATAAPFVLRNRRNLGLHPSVDFGRRAAQQSMPLSWARSIAGRQALREAGDLDAVVQIGTGYRIWHPRVASYEDMTIPQAIREPLTRWSDVPLVRRHARVRQQSAAYARLTGSAFATHWAARSAINDSGLASRKAHTVGIGPNFAPPTAASRDWFQPHFLFAGREWGRKNGDSVVRAFAEVRKYFPGARLDLAGDHPQIDQPGVHGHGYLSLREPSSRRRMEELWASATCCVVPSRFEPAGIIYVEAMHAGIPSIGTTRGGAPDVIGNSGIVVDPEDDDALVRAMLRVCEPEQAANFAKRARDRSREFTWDTVAKGLLQALDMPLHGVDELAPVAGHVEGTAVSFDSN